MKIPHTIPKVILRAFTRNLNEEELKKSYEGRLFVSEDVNWDEFVSPTLAQQCLSKVIDEFLFFNKLLEYFNELNVGDYENRKKQWEVDLAEYVEKKKAYDKKLAEYEMAIATGDDQFLTLDDDFDDDDDDHDVDKAKRGKPQEPEKIEDEFPDYEPVSSILDHLTDDDRMLVLEEIELDLVPFPLAVQIIPDEYYWERQARDRWQIFDVTDHANSWRRLFMEKLAWQSIEQFHPADDDQDKLLEDLKLIGEFVVRLFIQNLIPICFGTPSEDVTPQAFEGDNEFGADPEFDAGFGDGDMQEDPDEGIEMSEEAVKSLSGKKGKKKVEEGKKGTGEGDFIIPTSKRNPDMDRTDPSHLDFSIILPHFSNLKELSLIFEMVETGMGWEERFFKFTDTDCLNLAKALTLTPSLEKFELLRSRMTGEQCQTLVREGLIKMHHLKVVNFNYNRIGDVGAKAIARLLVDEKARAPHTIHTVRVARNRIRNKGGKALAFALSKNRHLSILDARLNLFGDPAGCDFGHALVKNTGLMALFLGANRLTEESAYILGKMLYHNQSLLELDVSSNDIGKKGGEYLALGMRNNKNILRLDIRLSNAGLDFEYDIDLHVRKNRSRLGASQSILESEDYYPRETESGMLDLEEEALEDESDEEEETEEHLEEETADEGDDDGDNDDDKTGGIVGGIAAAAFAAAGINRMSNAELALKDPEIAVLLAKAVGAGAGAGGMDALLKSTRKAMLKQTKSKQQVQLPPKKVESEVKVYKEPVQMKPSHHALA